MAVNKYKKYVYKIEASCGCKMTVEIGGYSEDYRQARKRELEAEECPRCAGKRRAEQVKNSLDFELAELEGSEKQIAWAESIRADKIRESKDNEEFIKILGNATSAKLLIENRNEELNTLIEKIIFSNVVIPERLEDEETFKTIEEEIIVASGYTKEAIEKFRRILIKKVETCGYLYFSKEDLERVLILGLHSSSLHHTLDLSFGHILEFVLILFQIPYDLLLLLQFLFESTLYAYA